MFVLYFFFCCSSLALLVLTYNAVLNNEELSCAYGNNSLVAALNNVMIIQSVSVFIYYVYPCVTHLFSKFRGFAYDDGNIVSLRSHIILVVLLSNSIVASLLLNVTNQSQYAKDCIREETFVGIMTALHICYALFILVLVYVFICLRFVMFFSIYRRSRNYEMLE